MNFNRCNTNSIIFIALLSYIFSIDLNAMELDSQSTNIPESIQDTTSTSSGSSSPSKNGEHQTIGEESLNETSHDLSRLFLRESEVLLNPKEIQLSIGFNYNTGENQRSFRVNRSRSISIPLSISYGWTQKLEINASLPISYNENEIISPTNVSKSSDSGVGDMTLGVSYKLKTESESLPSITASLNVTTPTGETTSPENLDGLSSGTGFWGFSTALNLSKTIDPAIVFFNIGYQHVVGDDQFGSHIQPGDSLSYGFGAGFSVNSAVAFSARISGSYQKDTELDKERVRGTSSEPVVMIGSMSYKIANTKRLETTFDLGASESANDVGMGLSYIWNF